MHNRRTYPNLLRLFQELGVATQESEMRMSVRCEGCEVEYAGARGLRGLLAQPRNILRGSYLRMPAEVPRFHLPARRLLGAGADDTLMLGAFLDRTGFSSSFRAHFMTPVVSAVWSCDAETALKYPAAYLFRFLAHHGMLSVSGSPVSRTVTGGSKTYVDRIAADLHEVRVGAPVRSVLRHTDGVDVTAADDTTTPFDHIVLATHPDQALRLLADATPEEEVLGVFRCSSKATLVHTDTSLLPRAHGARASWNYLMPCCRAGADQVRVSYDMNRLQRLDAAQTYVVTPGGQHRVDPARVLARMTYEHPIYTPESVAAQRRLPSLNTTVTAFAGAYHGWGFHEDGCRRGAEAAALGVRW
ncbi:NAD(P)/FAD-dependent oxidoreductase [Streptomyces adustus]|uniref:NAD(P)/FAD-dependent oxidoreductase n=1 Tax=Streptomyces adustus TaxID=1609272 RepID=UPI003719574D